MARLFIDTNYYIDVVYRNTRPIADLNDHLLFISTLSTHILFYTQKIKVPNDSQTKFQELFGFVPLTKHILDKSLQGPTSDLENNIQLHSCIEVDCTYFLTSDKKLLNMKFFGKTLLVETIPTREI